MRIPRGLYSRGCLPHIDAGAIPQFVTWRLADSLPNSVIDSIRAELDTETELVRKREMYRRVEAHLDLGEGSCVLRNPVAARIVQEALLHGHLARHQLHAWCVMPNHVHVLLTPVEEVPLFRLIQSIKSYSAKMIHRALGTSGRFWQPDYFDRAIRDERHFEATAKYIEWNPVKATLCADPAQFPYSSANPVNAANIVG